MSILHLQLNDHSPLLPLKRRKTKMMKDAVVLRNDVKEPTTLKTLRDQQTVLPLFFKGGIFILNQANRCDLISSKVKLTKHVPARSKKEVKQREAKLNGVQRLKLC